MSRRDIKAGRAFVEVALRDQVTAGLQALQTRLRTFSSSIASIGGAVTASGLALSAPLVALAQRFASAGSELDDIAKRTGLSVQALSELKFAAEESGQNLAFVETIVRRMTRSIDGLIRGSKKAQADFGRLGLRAEDLAGLAPDQQLERIADAMAAIPDPAKRAAIGMKIFQRSGTDILPLIADGAEGIRKLRQQARDLGLTMNDETAASAAALAGNIDLLRRLVVSSANAIGGSVAPVLNEWFERSQALIVSITRLIKDNREWGATLLKVGVIVFGVGAALTALAGPLLGSAALVTTLSAAWSVLSGSMLIAFTPVALIARAVIASAYAFFRYTEAGRAMASQLSSLFSSLRPIVLGAIGDIATALLDGDLARAGQSLVESLRDAWSAAITPLAQVWDILKSLIAEKLRGLVEIVTATASAISDRLGKLRGLIPVAGMFAIVAGQAFLLASAARRVATALGVVRIAAVVSRAALAVWNIAAAAMVGLTGPATVALRLFARALHGVRVALLMAQGALTITAAAAFVLRRLAAVLAGQIAGLALASRAAAASQAAMTLAYSAAVGTLSAFRGSLVAARSMIVAMRAMIVATEAASRAWVITLGSLTIAIGTTKTAINGTMMTVTAFRIALVSSSGAVIGFQGVMKGTLGVVAAARAIMFGYGVQVAATRAIVSGAVATLAALRGAIAAGTAVLTIHNAAWVAGAIVQGAARAVMLSTSGAMGLMQAISLAAAGGVALLNGSLGVLSGAALSSLAPVLLVGSAIVGLGAALIMNRETVFDKLSKSLSFAQPVIDMYAKSWGGFIGSVSNWFGSVVSEARIAWGGISDALAVGDMSLAWEIAWNTMKLVTLRTIAPLRVAWSEFTTGLASAMDGVIVGIRTAWSSLSTSIARFFVGIMGHVQDLIDKAAEFDPTGMAAKLSAAISIDTEAIDKLLADDARRFTSGLTKGLDARNADRAKQLGEDLAAIERGTHEAETAIKDARDRAVEEARKQRLKQAREASALKALDEFVDAYTEPELPDDEFDDTAAKFFQNLRSLSDQVQQTLDGMARERSNRQTFGAFNPAAIAAQLVRPGGPEQETARNTGIAARELVRQRKKPKSTFFDFG